MYIICFNLFILFHETLHKTVHETVHETLHETLHEMLHKTVHETVHETLHETARPFRQVGRPLPFLRVRRGERAWPKATLGRRPMRGRRPRREARRAE